MPRINLTLPVVVFACAAVFGCTRAADSNKIDKLQANVAELTKRLLPAAKPGARGLGEPRKQGGESPFVRIERRLDRLERMISRRPGRAPARPNVRRADPTATYSVPIAGAPINGAANALVTVVKGFDFGCPHCKRVTSKLDQLKKHYGDNLRIAYKHFPRRSAIPALASCAAAQQGKWDAMYKAIFSKFGRFGAADMDAHAEAIGLDLTKYRADMKGVCAKQVQRDQQQLRQVGTRGVPAFYINGRYLAGNQPLDNFKRLIDEEMKKAKAALAKGAKAANYYQQTVVRRGKKRI